VFHRFLTLHLIALCVTCIFAPAGAQELRQQPTPFSTWIDFQTLGSPHAPRQPLPIWLDSVEKVTQPVDAQSPVKTTFRVRLRRYEQLNSRLQVRVFFTDRADALPVITGWSETGSQAYQSNPLGNGLNFPTSETLVIPGENLDYLDVAVAGDGKNLRGVFLATLGKSSILRALDFADPAEVTDPFSNLPPLETSPNDSYLFGRVRATLGADPVPLTPTDPGGLVWEIELDAVPLIAVVWFEVLGADPLRPPEWIVNDRPLGAASIRLPDLADPAYQAIVHPLEPRPRFHYNGWLHGQQVIPGSALRSGLNKVALRLNKESGPVAVRSVELLLKHHWEFLDYKLAP
jgi:hypothetical protein